MIRLKPIVWMCSTKEALLLFPSDVQDEIGYALYQAQKGTKSDKAKPLKGFGSAAVLEVVENHANGTYRAVYSVKFKEAVVVLHVFQKKSKHGIATPQQDIELVKSRLKLAQQEHQSWLQT